MSILYLVTIKQRSYIVSVHGFIKKKKKRKSANVIAKVH